MTTKNQTDSVLPLPLLQQSAKKGGSKCPLRAESLHKRGDVYIFYGALDGLSLSASTLKYSFDMLVGDSGASSSDLFHEWGLTPLGIAGMATSSGILLLFSILANLPDNPRNKFFSYLINFTTCWPIRYIIQSWPTIRDSLKALKNSYKSIRSLLNLLDSLKGASYAMHFIMPFSLVFAGVGILSRFGSAGIIAKRKNRVKINGQLLLKIKNSRRLTAGRAERIKAKIKKPSKTMNIKAYIYACLTACVDDFGLHLSLLFLGSLAPPALIAMTVLSIIYFLVSLAARINDEREEQRKLLASGAKIELALLGRDIETTFLELQKISKLLATDCENRRLLERQAELIRQLKRLVPLFEAKRVELLSLTTISYTSALLTGFKKGLSAYGILIGLMFVIVMFGFTICPPPMLISFISIGIGVLFVSAIYALLQHRRQHREQQAALHSPNRLSGLLKIKEDTALAVKNLRLKDLKDSLLVQMFVDFSPRSFVLEWLEVLRCFFSGFGKGLKAIDFSFNCMQKPDMTGHYRDTAIMGWITIGSALLHAFVLSLRAYARGLGNPSTVVPLVDRKTLSTDSLCEEPYNLSVKESEDQVEKAGINPDGLKQSHSLPDLLDVDRPTNINELTDSSAEYPPDRKQVGMTRNNSYPGFFKNLNVENNLEVALADSYQLASS